MIFQNAGKRAGAGRRARGHAGKLAATAALAVGLVAGAVPGTASASATGDNSRARVWGPVEGWLPDYSPDIPCPVGAICLYKDETYRYFVLPHCTTYKLYDWNGVGSWYSRQTGGAWGQIQNSAHKPIKWMGPEQNGYFDFSPAYFVVPC
ncbi:hypothetical protein [Streptomyces sp. NBC_00096]|uniref:hypothetical protein n=1 Tax=Streptomyces sp. NBC_00096 TaxID=2975650 RepID=UPI003245F242